MGNKDQKKSGKSGRKPWYRNKGKNGTTKSNNKSKSAVREYKFHMHDADARKTPESFRKIKEATALKI